MASPSPQELEALIAENRRLKEEVSRLAKSMEESPTDPPKLFRPPWQQELPKEPLEKGKTVETAVAKISDGVGMDLPNGHIAESYASEAEAEDPELEDVLEQQTPTTSSKPPEATLKLPPLQSGQAKQANRGRRPSWRPPQNIAGGWQQAPTLMGGSFAMGYPKTASLPALHGQRGKEDSLRGRGAEEEEYADRILDDVRQALVSKTGSIQAAYDLLDMRKTGWADARMLNMAFDELNSGPGSGGPTIELPTVDEIFDALGEKRGGMVWLQELLDFTPREKQKEKRMKDTRALWQDYEDKTSASPMKLPRQPRWRHEMKQEGAASAPTLPPLGKDWDSLVNSKQRRQEIRRQFREDRQGITAEQKRNLVQGLVAPEETTKQLDMEQRKLEGHRQRIRETIKDCSKSRFELVEMQRKMAGLVDASEKKSEARALRSMFQAKLLSEDKTEKTLLSPSHLPKAEANQKSKSPSKRSVAFSIGDLSNDA
mmetsp:Transcript_47739/g.85962  ORF Transcript_47739/g.85962 Transcript_47739/m.85962 type:complete len:485 (-) Transcript_47739:78-1532(-)